jgi:hypothetical protein
MNSIQFAYALFFAGGPAIIFLHEVGHWTCMRSFGYPATIHAASTRWGENQVQNETEAWPRIEFLCNLAGPAVNAGLAIVGLIFLRRYAKSSAPTLAILPGFWIATLASLAGLRWLQSPFKYPADELHLSQQLGLDPFVVPTVMLPVSTIVLILIINYHVRAATIKPLSIAICFGIAGALFWLFLLGPVLLGA